MNNGRNLLSWLLLGLLTVLALGGAVLGIAQAPKDAPLDQAVSNTLSAANYSEVHTENTPGKSQTDYLVYQAPDRLGGYIDSASQRIYVYVIGKFEYQSASLPKNADTSHLVLYRRPSQGAQALDPAHGFLPYAQYAKNIQKSGDTYSFTLSKSSLLGQETGEFTYTVIGPYVSEFTLSVAASSVQLIISQVGSSPPVALPAGSKVVVVKAPGA